MYTSLIRLRHNSDIITANIYLRARAQLGGINLENLEQLSAWPVRSKHGVAGKRETVTVPLVIYSRSMLESHTVLREREMHASRSR